MNEFLIINNAFLHNIYLKTLGTGSRLTQVPNINITFPPSRVSHRKGGLFLPEKKYFFLFFLFTIKLICIFVGK